MKIWQRLLSVEHAMKNHHIFYILFLLLAPISVKARPEVLYPGSDISYTAQKNYAPVVDKALQLMAADLKKTATESRRRAPKTELLIFQLDIANNKDMKTLGEMRAPILDIITRKDAFWLGRRGDRTVIVGSNGRGTAYGILRFAATASKGLSEKGETQLPSVEYRGISLEGHRLTDYRRLFEQMLRHRANLLCEGWDSGEAPAHFTHGLRALADTFGIVLATPHGAHTLHLQEQKKSLSVDIGWADDNYGYIAPADGNPDKNCGAVYHLAYAGRPHSYLWLCTTQPALIANEMTTAYRRGADRMWMAVVYNPDVAAYQLSLFLDMAWNIKAVNPTDVSGHLYGWLAANFSRRAADALVKPLAQYFQLTTIRRPEMMDFTQQKASSRHNRNGDGGVANTEFNAEEFGNELERYLNRYDEVCQQVLSARQLVADRDSDKFFILVEYPVYASAQMAVKMLEAQESRLIARPESFHHDSEALESAVRSIRAYRKIQKLTSRYNNAQARLRRNTMMDAAPQGLTVFGKPQLTDTLSEVEIRLYDDYAHSDAQLVNDNCIISHAAAYAAASSGATTIGMLGRSMRAVELSRGDSLTYRFVSDTTGGTLRLGFVPTQALDGGMSQASVSIDGGAPRTVIITDGSRSDRWADGVMRGQARISLPIALNAGSHTLVVKALNDHVVFDEWMIDNDADRQFYVFPIEPKLP